jgi:hypothetical protein
MPHIYKGICIYIKSSLERVAAVYRKDMQADNRPASCSTLEFNLQMHKVMHLSLLLLHSLV